MLAYLFWHRPFGRVDRKLYEEALLRFQSDLAAANPAGFIGASSFQIEPVRWLDDLPGYKIGTCSKVRGPLTRSMRLRLPATCRRHMTTSLP
jgi:hypothetical protein